MTTERGRGAAGSGPGRLLQAALSAGRLGFRAVASLAVVLPMLLSGCAAASASAGDGTDLAATERSGAGPYHVYVANESSDVVSRVAFEPGAGARVENEIPTDVMPGDIDGPHGIRVSPDGERWYATVAHGTPFGSVWAFRTGADTLIGRTTLGRFPATMATAGDGRFLIVANFDLHGDPVPSDLSVIYAPDLTELTRITTCLTPHGSRTNASGNRHYSVCMRSDQLVEVAVPSFEISSRFSVRPREETTLPSDELGAELPPTPADPPVCSPTWVTPGQGPRADRRVYVACNRSGDVLEVDVEEWAITRRFELGSGPYNMDLTPDGRTLVATLKSGQAIAVLDLETGEVRARLETSRPVTHGVAISSDGRYAFVTNESVGSVRGTLDVFDLARLERVDTVELQHQPGGIDVWRGP